MLNCQRNAENSEICIFMSVAYMQFS